MNLQHLPATLLIVVALLSTTTTVFAQEPIGSVCRQDSDCETRACFFGFENEGVCTCNTDTNQGCSSPATCSIDISQPSPALPPFCALQEGQPCDLQQQGSDCFLTEQCCKGKCSTDGGICKAYIPRPIGETCGIASDCDSNFCFRSIQPADTPGRCQCNVNTNAGCPPNENRTCQFFEFFADGPPACALPMGAACNDTRALDCDTTVCWNGTCQCNINLVNLGCTGDDVCVGDEEVGYTCKDTSEPVGELLPIGAACQEKSECVSDFCFVGFGDGGVCTCNPRLNTGCNTGTECVVGISESSSAVPPYCALPDGAACSQPAVDTECFLQDGGCCRASCLQDGTCETISNLPFGSPCRINTDCESNVCFYGLIPPGSPGSCQCNVDTNVGCTGGRTCTFVETVMDAPAFCGLPIGASCDAENPLDCSSTQCFNGTCQCHKDFNAGCAEGQVCVGDENTGYTCNDDTSEPGEGSPIGSVCKQNMDCLSDNCFFGFGDGGVCSCNTRLNTGCDSATECVAGISESRATVPPYCALPDGAACQPPAPDTECFLQDGCCRGSCLQNGTCETVSALLPVGSTCRENADCESNVCFFGLVPPGTPGNCQCNLDTNDGCNSGRTCTVLQFLPDAPPFCGLPVGATCDPEITLDCSTTRCFEGTCQCLEEFNAGCSEGQVCVGDESTGYSCTSTSATATLRPTSYLLFLCVCLAMIIIM